MRKTWLWLLFGCAATTGACAQILGDDFCRADDPECPDPTVGSGGDGEGAGGAGGAAGGAGGQAILLDCDVVPGTYFEVESLEGEPVAQQWNQRIHVVASDDDELFFAVTRNLAVGPWLEIYRHGVEAPVGSVAGEEVVGVGPIDGNRVGVLFTVAGELRLVRSGDTLSETLATATALSTAVDAGLFQQIPGGDLVFVLSSSEGGDSRALFGRYAGSPVVPARFTVSDNDLVDRDVRPAAIVRQGTLNHVFLGEAGSPNGGRHYAFDDAPAEQAPTLQLGQGFGVLQARGNGPDLELVVADGTNADVLALRAATVPFADLPSLDASELPITAQLAAAEIPAESNAAFGLTHLAVVGGVAGDPLEATLLVVAFAGGLVAQGTLELGAVLGDVDSIDELHVRPRNTFSSSGILDAVVMTSHEGGAFKKLHTLEVQCVAP